MICTVAVGVTVLNAATSTITTLPHLGTRLRATSDYVWFTVYDNYIEIQLRNSI